MANERKKKATISHDFDCPCCKKRLHIDAFRKRTNPTVKAEWEIYSEVTEDRKQNLPGMNVPDQKDDKNAATKVTKKGAAAKKKPAPSKKQTDAGKKPSSEGGVI